MKFSAGGNMDYARLLELVKKRRSIRRFKPDPIPDEHIEKIIEVARWAPSGYNLQPWEFVVVKKPELKNKIIEYCTEYRRVSPPIDATTYMHLAATSLGLASQWVSNVQSGYAHCMIKDLLGIRKEMQIYDMFVL